MATVAENNMIAKGIVIRKAGAVCAYASKLLSTSTGNEIYDRIRRNSAISNPPTAVRADTVVSIS
ncbi:hypothetical protein GCM10009000_083590 [Halobacterium noricense]|uniref:Uncharacterized protein n=1 Tax=Haladaptatus pallidirubidus TaxID=1008152 RepID=A0AAV3UR52_9EURY